MSLTRRSILAALAASALRPCRSSAQEPDEAAPKQPTRLSIGFSLYGMKDFKLGDALEACGRNGYDDVEFALMEGWPGQPSQLNRGERAQLRSQMLDIGLRVPALMENLELDVDDIEHAANLEKLRQAAYLGRDLQPDEPPLVETVLGGKRGEWEERRERMAERLKDWARLAVNERMTIALKAHVSGAVHLPEQAVWLVKRAGTRRVRLVYDYSHFQLQGLSLESSLETMAPYTAFVHVKDAAGDADHPRFLLPGEGGVDYEKLARLLVAQGYGGSVTVEVSSQIQRRDDYHPLGAAIDSYDLLEAAFESAGVRPTFEF